jgi:hypothetical protein
MPVTFNALSSLSNKGVSQPPSESPPVDSRDAAMSSLFESGRIRRRQLSYEVLVTPS